MELPEYVSLEEVKRVCQELNIRDWTILTEAKVQIEEARVIMEQIDLGGMDIPVEDFCTGLEVELEHGLRFKEANVTNNHPILTAKIVLAHFKESLDYYQRLEVAELEGDLLKAVKAQNWPKVERIYKELAHARLALSQAEIRLLS
ncbi:MAG: hypothetical protein BZ151_03185 [Desulfobacca sp. 4484_104]|nr:MAG: hypothetical protein BZ151_03185 [Desulfobacca sp. 4484_104]